MREKKQWEKKVKQMSRCLHFPIVYELLTDRKTPLCSHTTTTSARQLICPFFSIYMASAAPGEDNGHKNQPISEPVPQTIELI